MKNDNRISIELLAPAKDKYVGMAAIAYGADAVYIGADRFGARASATNSLSDIADLCDMAHRYGAKIYVTVNTVVFDDELSETEQLIDELAGIGVDAVLLQDMGVVDYARERVEIHASTQTDNRTPDKVKWLHAKGFQRVVLARELSVAEIAEIHREVPDVELEAFVHGALCVSFSGQCYASEYCFQRSANRGECAQMCRMEYDLENNDGEKLIEKQHLLSLKDMCRIDSLEEMMAAGVTSFKIEGRLKDIGYVKNVVAAFNKRLNEVIAKNPEKYVRQSLGSSNCDFIPNVEKSFNRGFTNYFLHNRERNIIQPFTPKSIGEFVGYVTDVSKLHITTSSNDIHNGDGLCFFDEQNHLVGFKVNRSEQNRIHPHRMPNGLQRGMELYRNHDHNFQTMLSHDDKSQRKIDVDIKVSLHDGVVIKMEVIGRNICAEISIENNFESAQKLQEDNIKKQLSRLGDTIYRCHSIDVEDVVGQLFIPSSKLSQVRRDCVEALDREIEKWQEETKIQHRMSLSAVNDARKNGEMSLTFEEYPRAYLYNIYNNKAQDFYGSEGKRIAKASSQPLSLLMQCRHCLRFYYGMCKKYNATSTPKFSEKEWKEPMFLRLATGQRFRLEFDCRNCQMNILAK